jgi:hypothetical protein
MFEVKPEAGMPTLKDTAVVLEAAATDAERLTQLLAAAAVQWRDAVLDMTAFKNRAEADEKEITRLRQAVAALEQQQPKARSA